MDSVPSPQRKESCKSQETGTQLFGRSSAPVTTQSTGFSKLILHADDLFQVSNDFDSSISDFRKDEKFKKKMKHFQYHTTRKH